jgi:hypothetical protein
VHKCRSAKLAWVTALSRTNASPALDQSGGLEEFEGFGDGNCAADLVNQLPNAPAAVAVLKQEGR